ncbi:PAS domain S-box protein [Christiangramia flava]|uniref:histidine kinase n=1 Tax=Christiangramia flava JLT2011 TaxID=1229726 RepID=A0A1L7I4X6_9FLAO|nr:PAS domain S-box protein [Christiangramia flava]APU68668.1 sensory box histidine kinase [Christiangramia flava JLT2011]OSS38193.1 sensory box histidine kinase [Christiangramia flava JLT2011]
MERRQIVNNPSQKVWSKPLLAGAFTFLLVVIIGFIILWQRYQIMIETRQREMSGIINVVEQNIEQSLKYSYSAALSLALQINEDGEIEDFDHIASQLVDQNSNIDGIETVPGGIIDQVYPYEQNKAAIGYNILADSTRNAEAQIAIEEKKMFFAGPVELRQGGYSVIGRLPVFIKDQFWGFTAVLIDFNKILETSGIEQFSAGDYKFQFAKVNPETGEEDFLLDSIQLDHSYSEEVTLPEGDWKIYIVPDKPNHIFYSLLPVSVLVLLLGLAFAFLVYRFMKQPQVLEEQVRKKSGELAASELRFRTIFNQAAIGMVRVDSTTGMILETNKRFQELLGYTNEELQQMDYRMVSHPEDITDNTQLMSKLRENQLREYSLQKRLKRKDGKTIWIKLNVSPLWPPGEPATSHIALIEDISAQVKAKEKLEENEKRFRSLVENTNEIILIINRRGEVVYHSPSLKKVTGYDQLETFGNEILSFIHPVERSVMLKKLEESYYAEGVPFSEIIMRFKAQQGHYIWMSATLTNMLHEKNINGYVVNLRDISGKKEAELNLMKSYDFVMEQNKRLLNFAYIVSHNLRSHSSNFESILELYDLEDDQEERQNYINLLRDVSASLNQTLVDLNEVVSINTNLEIKAEEIQVREYTEKALAVLSLQIESMNAKIINEVPENMKVIFNPAYMESILLNFITNALRYSRPDTIPEVHISAEKEKDRWVLKVCDNGIGIDLEKHKDKVFGLYKTFTDRKDSRGVGLFITKNQVNAMGGEVGVESTLGEGTCFKVFFK